MPSQIRNNQFYSLYCLWNNLKINKKYDESDQRMISYTANIFTVQVTEITCVPYPSISKLQFGNEVQGFSYCAVLQQCEFLLNMLTIFCKPISVFRSTSNIRVIREPSVQTMKTVQLVSRSYIFLCADSFSMALPGRLQGVGGEGQVYSEALKNL